MTQDEALTKKADNAKELGLDYEPENTLHWHALNYRTAPTQNAQKMFEALEQFVAAKKRNDTLEEVAKEFDKMKVFGDTAASFAIFVREMKL